MPNNREIRDDNILTQTIKNLSRFVEDFALDIQSKMSNEHKSYANRSKYIEQDFLLNNVIGPLTTQVLQLLSVCDVIKSVHTRGKKLSHAYTRNNAGNPGDGPGSQNSVTRRLEDWIQELKPEWSETYSMMEAIRFNGDMDDNNIYIGQIDENESRNGQGFLQSGQEVYKGGWKKGKRYGYGTQIFENGSIYEGMWISDKPQIGKWTLPDRSQFYGRSNALFKEERLRLSPKEMEKMDWMIGIKKVDSYQPLVNLLYYGENKTGISNLNPNQDLDIGKLKQSFYPEVTSLEWVNGLKYRGSFFEFKPYIFGSFLFKDGSEVKILSSPDYNLAIESIYPSSIAKVKKEGRMRVEFLEGGFFDGEISEDLSFEGVGHFGNKQQSHYCLFTLNEGLSIRFDNNDQKTIEFVKKVGKRYFINSEDYPKTGLLSQGDPWLSILSSDQSKIIKFKGGWKNFNISGDFQSRCEAIVDGKHYKGYIRDGVCYTVKDLDLAKEGLSRSKDWRQVEVSHEYVNGLAYQGNFNFNKSCAQGFGTVFMPNGKVFEGFWEDNQLKFDLSLVKNMTFRQMRKLSYGKHRVEYKNGIVYDGEWNDCAWVGGQISSSGTDVMASEKESGAWDPNKRYLTKPQKGRVFDLKCIFLRMTDIQNSFSDTHSIPWLVSNLKNREDEKLNELKEMGMVTVSEKDHDLKINLTVKLTPDQLKQHLQKVRDLGQAYDINMGVKGNSKYIDLLSTHIYSERKSTTPIEQINDPNFDLHFKEIKDNQTFFKKLNYDVQKKRRAVGFDRGGTMHLPGFGKTLREGKAFAGILKKTTTFQPPPIYPYLEISNSGLLKCSISLFQPAETIQDSPLLIYNDKIQYTINELYKLNGICQIDFDGIKFFNGTEYKFRNSERSHLHSLGGVVRSGGDWTGSGRKAASMEQYYYWSLFMNRVLMSNFDEEFFKTELEDQMTEIDLTGFNDVSIKFATGDQITAHWCLNEMFGQGKLFKVRKLGNGKNQLKEFEGLWVNNSYYSAKNPSGTFIGTIQQLEYQSPQTLRRLVEPFINRLRTLPNLGSKPDHRQFPGFKPKFESKLRQEVEITINKKESKDLYEDYLDSKKIRPSHINKLLRMTISYPNGDYFEGTATKDCIPTGQGVYYWRAGYKFEGEFFAGVPFGEGVYTDCLGTQESGFFYKGYKLKSPYGLDALKNRLEDIIKDSKSPDDIRGQTMTTYKRFDAPEQSIKLTTLRSSELELLIDDEEMAHGHGLLRDIVVDRVAILLERNQGRGIMRKRIQSIEDGEVDYSYDWEQKADSMIRFVLINQDLKETYSLLGKGYKLNSVNNLSLQRMVTRASKQPDFLSPFNYIQLGEMLEKMKLKRHKTKFYKKTDVKRRHFWITKMDIDSLRPKEVEQIIELIRDADHEGFTAVYKLFNAKNKVFKLLNLKDIKMRNLLMNAGFLGHGQMFLDLLSALNRTRNTEDVTDEQVFRYLSHTDYEQNNVIDLISIKGFSITEKVYMTTKIDKNQRQGYDMPPRAPNRRRDVARGTIFEQSIFSNKRTKIKILKEAYKHLDSGSDLFKSKFLSYERLYETSHLGAVKSSDLLFMTERAFCLHVLFYFCEKSKFKLLKRAVYDNKKNNPLHFTFFWADLHACLALIRYKKFLLLWTNHENEMPATVIRKSKKNIYKARAIFASILNEFLRNYNLYLIEKLFVGETGILEKQARRLGLKFDDHLSGPARRKRVQNVLKLVKKRDFLFDKVYLFHNNYVLLSDELCRQYLQKLKIKSRYRFLKQKTKMMKTQVFVECSELEALQRNLLDYHKDSFIGYHGQVTETDIQEDVQEILVWYIAFFGDAEIRPEIYTHMKIDPFALVLDGRNIFHFMASNNSYLLLESFLDYLYERCHKVPFDQTRGDYVTWDKNTLDSVKFKRFQDNLNLLTRTNQNSAMHLCVMSKSSESFEVLMKYDLDMEVINLRGRSVRELYEDMISYNSQSEVFVSLDKIYQDLMDSVRAKILATCKQHSLAYEFLGGNSKYFGEIFSKSKFELPDKLRRVRSLVYQRLQTFIKDMNRKTDMSRSFKDVFDKYKEIIKGSKENQIKEEGEIRRQLLEDTLDRNSDGPGTLSTKERVMKDTLLKLLQGDKRAFVPEEERLKKLFEVGTLETLSHFKYKTDERMVKYHFLKELKNTDFAKPLDSKLKYMYGDKHLLCIEVRIRLDEQIEDNVILDQLENIKQKYQEFSGGLEVNLIKGFIERDYGIFGKKRETWYLLVTLSDRLLYNVAARYQMGAYNMTNMYHTVFLDNYIQYGELEPLRHYQKINVAMKLIKQEFSIDNYTRNGQIVKYFPVHDYKKRRVIEREWEKNAFRLHALDLFTSTVKEILKVYSLITFYHGLQQGFYFGFLSVYTNSLFLLFVFGIIALILEGPLNVHRDIMVLITSVVVGLWSTVMLNRWKRREQELAYSFDAFEDERIPEKRELYREKMIIDKGVLGITKAEVDYVERRFLITTVLFIIGFIGVLGISFLIQSLTDNVTDDTSLSTTEKFYYSFAIGILNATLNFILTAIYQFFVYLVMPLENHWNEADRKKSIVVKIVSFKIVSATFTLVALSLLGDRDYEFFTAQVLSNLATNAVLTYGATYGLPILLFLIKRYYLFSYIFTCKCCCCIKPRGKIEDMKREMLLEFASSSNTSLCFTRYCLGKNVLPPDLKKQATQYRRKKEEEKNKKDGVEGVQTGSGSMTEKKQKQRLGQKRSEFYQVDNEDAPLNPSTTSLDIAHTNDEDVIKLENIEDVSMPFEFKSRISGSGRKKYLGRNKKKNISMRLKEEYAKYTLGREKIIESSYMIDLASLELDMNFNLLTQFTFVVFFSPYLTIAGMISYGINLFSIFLIILVYTRLTRRSISLRIKDMGIWNKLYSIISYSAILYNSMVIINLTAGLDNVLTWRTEINSNQCDEKNARLLDDNKIILAIHFALILVKLLAEDVVNRLPAWISRKITKEKLTKEKVRQDTNETLRRIGVENSQRVDGKFDRDVFKDQESRSLENFFNNDYPVEELHNFAGIDKDEEQVVRISQEKKNLM